MRNMDLIRSICVKSFMIESILCSQASFMFVHLAVGAHSSIFQNTFKVCSRDLQLRKSFIVSLFFCSLKVQ